MAKTFDEWLVYISNNVDEITLLEVLEITSEELVYRFEDKISNNMHKFIDIDDDEEEEQ